MDAAEARRGDSALPLVAGYRPWLDGLRAGAVLLVVVQHTMGAMPIDLGFVGVGVFFGLSGYLITSLLLDERDERGRVTLSHFYLRRAARLVPALLLLLVVCDVLFLLQGDPAPLTGSVAAVTYTSNYVHVVDEGLVEGFGPTWSLAVEEHFYVVWPLVLLAIVRRRSLRAALTLTLVACLASLVWRVVLAWLHAPYSLLGVGSLERADALLYGCAAAMALRLGWRPSAWMLWLGIATVGASTVLFNHESYFVLVTSSAVVGLAAAAVVVGMDYAAPRWMRRVLSLRPVVAVGVLSYGIYLWHAPLMRLVQNGTETGKDWRLVAALMAFPIAALSHRYLEVPVRALARRRTSGATTPTPKESHELRPLTGRRLMRRRPEPSGRTTDIPVVPVTTGVSGTRHDPADPP